VALSRWNGGFREVLRVHGRCSTLGCTSERGRGGQKGTGKKERA
jgi:hypothetical protein